MPQVIEKVAVEQGLALLGQTQRVIQLGTRLARHEAAQKLHIGRRDFHIDHEIGAGEGEQQQQIVFGEQHRVDKELAALVVQDGQRQRKFGEAVDHLADRIRALVAVEQRVEHLNLEVGAQAHIVAEALAHSGQHLAHVAVQIFERQRKLKVLNGAAQTGVQRLVGVRVIHTEGRLGRRLFVFDVLGGQRRAHEQKLVVEMLAPQNLGRHRVEKRLGQFGLVVIGQQADVVQLGLLPDFHGLVAGIEFVLQPFGGFVHPLVVEGDALALRCLLPGPVGPLEPLLGRSAHLAEQAVMAIEAVEHGTGHGKSHGGIKARRELVHRALAIRKHPAHCKPAPLARQSAQRLTPLRARLFRRSA